MDKAENLIQQLASKIDGNYHTDFLQTWEKNDNAIAATVLAANILEHFYRNNLSARIFNCGTAISIFKDQSTRTRYSFDSATNLLGLNPVELDLGKSQVAHGETTRETVNMVSFLTRVIGIRDDIYLGVGHSYIEEIVAALDQGYSEGVLPYRPSVVNLQSDRDHPTQSIADLTFLAEHFGGLDQLKGKKLAMTWAYSPSYGKPLSVPQGIVGLMTKMGMEVTLAYPEGYHLIPEIEEISKSNSEKSGGSFNIVNSMEEAFRGADIVYPKSWASYDIMEQRTKLLSAGNKSAYEDLEKQALEQNAKHKNWECTEELMKLTKDEKALYMHCLPADITGVSCAEGEVQKSVFERYRKELYQEAGKKPFAIAAMILLGQCKDPVASLSKLVTSSTPIQL